MSGYPGGKSSQQQPSSEASKPSGPTVSRKPASRSQSNNERSKQQTQLEPSQELFLNVDIQYNDLILQMIQPNRSHFDFEGSVQYVMNASELSNQALAKLLYSRRNIPMP